MPGPSQRLKFDIVLPGVQLRIAPGGGVDSEALYDKHVNLRTMRKALRSIFLTLAGIVTSVRLTQP